MKIKKEDWAKLPEAMKAAFKPVIPDGGKEEDATEYDNGEEDAGSLKSALDHERAEKKRIAQERDALKGKEDEEAEKARKAAEKKAREDGDVKALEKSWKAKADADKAASDATLAARNAEIERLTVDAQVDKLAGIFTAPAAMKPYIKSRLKAEFGEDGKVSVRVLDADGKPSAATIEDFQKEMVDNSDFKGIIAASKGSGGGATNPGESGGGGGATPSKIDVNKASPSDMVSHLKASGKAPAGDD